MKKIRLFYVIIPLIVFGIAWLGQYFTAGGMTRYATLQLPHFTPPGWMIGIVRTIIFVLGALATILFRHTSEHDKKFGIAISLFIDNAILNILWSRLFFTKHLIGLSIVEMILLLIVTVILIIAVRPRSKRSGYLLIPYALRLIIATYYAINIYVLN